ncbi:hypothetical protein J7K25_07130 [bacterium]|nr:hypothetical protein [bacterium]
MRNHAANVYCLVEVSGILKAYASNLIKISNDFIIAKCTSRGTFQISEFIPLVAFAILESLQLLLSTNEMLKKYIEKINPNLKRYQEHFDKSSVTATAFLPYLEYEKVSNLLKEFFASGGKNIRKFLIEKLGKDFIEKVLSSYNLVPLRFRKNEKNT